MWMLGGVTVGRKTTSGARGGSRPRIARRDASGRDGNVGRRDFPTGRGSGVQAHAGRRVGALDGLRVLSMAAIVVYHANASWLPGGFLGVTVFFTLSGYLVTDALLREIKRNGGPLDVLGFYVRRLGRLWPLMVCVIAMTAILCAALSPSLLGKMRGDVVPALLFYENWWYIFRDQSYFAAAGLPSPITHFWFLAVIVQFYLVWPWAVLALTRILRGRRAAGRVVLALAVVLAFAASLVYDPKGDPSRVYYGTDARLAEILVGSWLAFVWPTEGSTSLSRTVGERLGGRDRTVVSDLIGLVALVTIGALCRALNGYAHILYRGGLFDVALLTAVVIAAVVRPGSWLGAALGSAPLSVVAKRTFGIYLWHYPLLLIMNPATRTTALPWWGWVLELVVIAVAVELSFALVEGPASALVTGLVQRGAFQGDRRAGRRASPAPALVGVYALVALSAGALIYVGPFWYEDGAAQQLASTAAQGAPAKEGDSGDAGAPVDDADATLTVSAVMNDSIGYLEQEMRGTTYAVDPETGATDAPVILIGDSVPAAAVDQFYATFPDGYIDATVGRQLYDADDVYLADLAAGHNQRIVVFASGNNSVATEQDVQDLIDAAGNRMVYLVTVRVPYPLQDMNNALFHTFAETHDNVEVIDWYGESEGHDEYFWDDGTHLRPEGADAYVLMLRRAVCGE